MSHGKSKIELDMRIIGFEYWTWLKGWKLVNEGSRSLNKIHVRGYLRTIFGDNFFVSLVYESWFQLFQPKTFIFKI